MFVYAFGFNGFKQLKNTSKEHNSSIIWRKTSICHANNALQLYAKEGKFYSHCSSWESFIFLKEEKIHVHGFCGCSIHSTHQVPIIDIADSAQDIAVLVNAGNVFGILNKFGKLLIFKISCFKDKDSEYHSTLSILFEYDKICCLADSDFNASKFILVNEHGKLVTLKRQFDSQSIWTSSEFQLREKVNQICCGNDHCLAVTHSGKIFSWGIGSRGQLGHGNLMPQDHPKFVEVLGGVFVKQIACGGWHSVALADTNDLYSWGWNESGQTGFPTPPNALTAFATRNIDSTPSTTGNLLRESDAKTNTDHVLLNEENDPAIGGCESAEISNCNVSIVEPTSMLSAPLLLELERYLPTREDDFVSIVDVACGSRHTIALSSTGQVLSWGWAKYGQLGQACCVLNGVVDRADGVTKPTCKDAAHLPGLVDLSYAKVKVRRVACGSWSTLLFTDCIME